MKFKSDIEVQAGLKDSSGSNGSSGQVLSSDGTTVSWVNAGSSVASDVQNEVKAGVAINKGQAVYVTGADGTNIIVGLASNTSEATSSKTLGLLNATVAVNGFADVVQIGKLSGLNTIGANTGDPVWLGVNGNLIYGLANKPYAPAHLVFIGIVTRVNANNGEIFVTVQNGFELKEIHDVDIITNVPINGDVLGYDGTLWVNKTIAEWLGYTPADQAITISTTAPLSGGGNLSANRTLSIAQANATTNGYLSSADWTNFNNKQTALNGTGFVKVSGTTISYDNSTYVPTSRTITINGVTQDLSANQTWTVSGGIDGSGTANYVSKFIDADTIGNSLIYDNGSSVGIGINVPTARLDIRSSATSASTSSPTLRAFGYSTNSYFEINNNGNNSANIKLTRSDSATVFSVDGHSGLSYFLGNVLIGTTTDAGYKLDVNGSMRGTRLNLGQLGLAIDVWNFYSQTVSGAMGILGHNLRASSTVNNQVDVVNGSWYSSMIKQYYNEGITFHTSDTSYAAGAVYPIAATERMRIALNGNIGIGMTSPDPFKLAVNGSVGVMGTLGSTLGSYYIDHSGVQSWKIGVNNTNTSTLSIGNDVGGAFVNKILNLTNVGNVGIGILSPNFKIQSHSSGVNNYIQLTSATTGSASSDGLIIGTGDNGAAIFLNRENTNSIFYTNNTERMWITSSGNVLINGTGTDAGYKLDVNGTGRYSGKLTISADAGNEQLLIQRSSNTNAQLIIGYHSDGYGRIQAVEQNVGYRALVLNQSGGNVGIGITTPKNKLTVNGTITTKPDGVDAYYSYLRSNWSADNAFELGISDDGITNFHKLITSSNYYNGSTLQFWTNDAERGRFDISGNLGIGTTGPRTKLDVEAYTSFMSLSSTINSEATTANQQIGGIDFRKHYALAIGASIRLLQSGGVNNYSTSHLAFYTNDGSTAFNTVPPEKMRITSNGTVLINTQTDAGYRLDVNGTNRFQGYLNSNNCFERVFSQAINFPNGTADLAADVRLGNESFWGYIEVEVNSTYSNQNSTGKLTKVFAVGTNPNNLIYTNESRIVDSMGTIPDNIAIGDFSWDGTNSTYRIPISHIVSSGNIYTVKVRMFTSEDGASRVFNAMTISSNYSLAALARQYPYYNSRLGIGTSAPMTKLDLRGDLRVSGDGVNDGGLIGFGNYLNGVGYYDNAIYRSAFNSPTTPGNLLHISSYEALVFTTQAAQIGAQAIRMYINGSNGNVIIGGTADAGYKLNVNGGFYGSYFKGGDSGAGSVIANFVDTFGTSAMYVRGDNRVGIGTTSPQKPLEVISSSNDFVSVGVNQIAPGAWTGIHFGYRESNNSYRKSAIVFQRTDLTSNDAQGKVHILNGPQGSSGNATLADAKITIAENGNIGMTNTSPVTKLTLNGYSGSRLAYIQNTAYSFDTGGITVGSSTTSSSNKAGGIDLTNNTYSPGAYSPIISFSSLSSNSVYNNSYAGIWGVLGGQAGDANWVQGDLVFGTANSYGIQERMRIAYTGVTTFTNTVTATGFFNSSDIRLKEIVDYNYNISDIKPISYLWKDSRDNKKHVGYSAQEVQKVMPDAVNEGEDGMLSVNYIEVLVAKIAELENRIKQLEK